MPGLSLLLEQRAARIKRLESQPKPIPLKEHRDYGKYFTWLKEGKFSKGEISTQLLHAGLTPSKPGLQAVFSMFDQGSGSMDTRRLGACLHKLGIKYDRTLLDEATAAFDADKSGKIEFDEFVEMFATLRASDELRLGEIGAKVLPLDESEASDAKAAFDKIDADGSGAIDEGEVEALFKDVGLSATKKEIASLIQFLDTDKSGEIEFNEFTRLMEMAKGRQTEAGAPLNAVAALADLFEERRKADKVKQVAISAALAALHRGATTIKDIAMLAESTVRVLVGQQTSDAVTRILKEAGEGALEAALALARTELMLACETGDLDVVKKALAKGAPPDTRQRDCDGTFAAPEPTSLMASPRDPSLDEEPKHGAGRTVLLVALENGHAKIAYELIAAGATHDLADDTDGLTPLMMAPKALSVVKHAKLVDCLFGCGPAAKPDMKKADLDAKDEQAKTAVAWAQAGDHKPVIEVINKARARAANPEAFQKDNRRKSSVGRGDLANSASAGALGAKSKSGRRRSFSGSFGDKPEKKAA
ncbi:Ca2-binding protein [Aureococcus anophagefferens]|nr:Ca2-binding protein [Aureococcus anophagefferens]